jgi:hypothetical protein
MLYYRGFANRGNGQYSRQCQVNSDTRAGSVEGRMKAYKKGYERSVGIVEKQAYIIAFHLEGSARAKHRTVIGHAVLECIGEPTA